MIYGGWAGDAGGWVLELHRCSCRPPQYVRFAVRRAVASVSMILYSFCYTFDMNPAHRGAVAHTAKHPARHAGLTWFDVNATSDDKTTSGGRVHCQHPVPVTTELFCSRARPRPGALLTGLLQLTTTTAPTAWWRCCWLHLRCDCERMRTLIKNPATLHDAE